MVKKIALIAAALLVAYVLIVMVPRWIGNEKASERQRMDQMEQQANRRANSIAPGHPTGGPGGANIDKARANAAFSVNRSANEVGSNEEGENPPASEEEQQ